MWKKQIILFLQALFCFQTFSAPYLPIDYYDRKPKNNTMINIRQVLLSIQSEKEVTKILLRTRHLIVYVF